MLLNRYTIDMSEKVNSFIIDMAIEMCIDGVCDVRTIASQLLVPIQMCNPSGTLPRNGTFSDVLEYYKTEASNTAMKLVLDYLGIKVGRQMFFDKID